MLQHADAPMTTRDLAKRVSLPVCGTRSKGPVGSPAAVWIAFGLLLLALSTAGTAQGEESASIRPIDEEAYHREVTSKLLLAERVTLWTLIDSHEEFLGKYVLTQGYLATVSKRICLFPSKEFHEALFLDYATFIPPSEDPFTKYSPRHGDYVEIGARVTRDRRWDQVEGIGELFDEVVEIRESLAGPLRRYLEKGCDEQCERNLRGIGRPPASKDDE